jgi:hypothetical protein
LQNNKGQLGVACNRHDLFNGGPAPGLLLPALQWQMTRRARERRPAASTTLIEQVIRGLDLTAASLDQLARAEPLQIGVAAGALIIGRGTDLRDSAGRGPPFTRIGWRCVRYQRGDLEQWALAQMVRVE